MTVLAMLIEPEAYDRHFANEVARAIGVELVDLRQFEHALAERSDYGEGTVHGFIARCSLRGIGCGITSRQLADRIRERTLEIARGGNVLIVGWSVAAILRPFRHVAKVRIHAPMHRREHAVMRRCAYRDVQLARWDIDSADGLIARFLRRLFAADPSRHLFDLVVNSERVSSSECLTLICDMLGSPRYRETAAARAELASCIAALELTEQEHLRASMRGDAVVMVGPDRVPLSGLETPEQAIERVEQHLHGKGSSRAR